MFRDKKFGTRNSVEREGGKIMGDSLYNRGRRLVKGTEKVVDFLRQLKTISAVTGGAIIPKATPGEQKINFTIMENQIKVKICFPQGGHEFFLIPSNEFILKDICQEIWNQKDGKVLGNVKLTFVNWTPLCLEPVEIEDKKEEEEMADVSCINSAVAVVEDEASKQTLLVFQEKIGMIGLLVADLEKDIPEGKNLCRLFVDFLNVLVSPEEKDIFEKVTSFIKALQNATQELRKKASSIRISGNDILALIVEEIIQHEKARQEAETTLETLKTDDTIVLNECRAWGAVVKQQEDAVKNREQEIKELREEMKKRFDEANADELMQYVEKLKKLENTTQIRQDLEEAHDILRRSKMKRLEIEESYHVGEKRLNIIKERLAMLEASRTVFLRPLEKALEDISAEQVVQKTTVNEIIETIPVSEQKKTEEEESTSAIEKEDDKKRRPITQVNEKIIKLLAPEVQPLADRSLNAALRGVITGGAITKLRQKGITLAHIVAAVKGDRITRLLRDSGLNPEVTAKDSNKTMSQRIIEYVRTAGLVNPDKSYNTEKIQELASKLHAWRSSK